MFLLVRHVLFMQQVWHWQFQLACVSGGNGLRSAIAFEAEKGYQNELGNKMRFSTFLLSKILKICSRSKHTFAKNILEEADSYGIASISNRSKLLNKVSVLMGYDGLHDLIENERAEKRYGMNIEDFDVSFICKRFPSIILGSSLLVELYDGTANFSQKMTLLTTQDPEGFSSDSVVEEQEGDCLYETRESLYPAFPSAEKSLLTDDQSKTLAAERHSSEPVPLEESSNKVSVKLQKNVVPDELFLDNPISCIPGISNRRINQLENCGFHTVRKLLHHFPRTYADLQNAQIEIDDGQYLIFIGKILKSRGIKAGASFSILEVVVGCEIADDKILDNQDNSTDCGRKTIYVHLKQFFRGARFTSLPFLRIVEQKHREGDFVCVSGKVELKKRRIWS